MEDKLHEEYLSKFRFTEYHEPLKRWPFDVDDKIAAKIRKHGSFPKLLLEKSAICLFWTINFMNWYEFC